MFVPLELLEAVSWPPGGNPAHKICDGTSGVVVTVQLGVQLPPPGSTILVLFAGRSVVGFMPNSCMPAWSAPLPTIKRAPPLGLTVSTLLVMLAPDISTVSAIGTRPVHSVTG